MRGAVSVLGLLGRSAPRLVVQEAFVCQRCLHQQAAVATTSRQIYQQAYKSIQQTPFLHAFRSRAARNTRQASTTFNHRPLSAAAQAGAGKRWRFRETNSDSVAYWLLGSAASVFGIVIFGGLTRLTESGLSITEWRPVTGSLPPSDEEKWESEFALYRASPEFKLLNPRMTLEEFKQIYWMEWIHRLWGRVVGITFLLPTAYFVARRRVTGRMALKLLGICSLIGFQGFIGWWMVKSGLKDDLFAPGSHPRVSQYRLTAHLGTAFVCYLAMLWNALKILQENRLLSKGSANGSNYIRKISSPTLRVFRGSVGALAVLVFITAMSGGLVAGLDAGLIYNEFPYMGLGLSPPWKELFDPFYSHVADRSDLWWRNMLENPSLVQLDHRIMATTTFTAVMALWAYSRFNPRVRNALPRPVRKGVTVVVQLVWLQVTLGITTLIYLVPLPIASAHQAGALALLSGVLVLASRIWVPTRTAKLLALRRAQRYEVARWRARPSRRAPDAVLAARTG